MIGVVKSFPLICKSSGLKLYMFICGGIITTISCFLSLSTACRDMWLRKITRVYRLAILIYVEEVEVFSNLFRFWWNWKAGFRKRQGWCNWVVVLRTIRELDLKCTFLQRIASHFYCQSVTRQWALPGLDGDDLIDLLSQMIKKCRCN